MEQIEEHIIRVPVSSLHSFPDYPFHITDDKTMQQLIDSIRLLGVLTPVIIRYLDGNTWQLVSGHRRKYACELLGIEDIPAIVKDIGEDEAIIMMVDSNLQREVLLPSEKAKAYKLKLDAVKRQGARNDLTSVQNGQKSGRKSSRDLIAMNSPDSSTQIQRFIRLNKLIPDLMELVDQGRVAVTPAVELSYLTAEEQSFVVLTVESEQAAPSLSQAQRIRKLSKDGKLTDDTIFSILSEKKKAECWNLVLPMNKVAKYFPNTYTLQQMQDTIIQLLESWLRMKMSQEENHRGNK